MEVVDKRRVNDGWGYEVNGFRLVSGVDVVGGFTVVDSGELADLK